MVPEEEVRLGTVPDWGLCTQCGQLDAGLTCHAARNPLGHGCRPNHLNTSSKVIFPVILIFAENSRFFRDGPQAFGMAQEWQWNGLLTLGWPAYLGMACFFFGMARKLLGWPKSGSGMAHLPWDGLLTLGWPTSFSGWPASFWDGLLLRWPLPQ